MVRLLNPDVKPHRSSPILYIDEFTTKSGHEPDYLINDKMLGTYSTLSNSSALEELPAGEHYDLYIENVIALTAICFAHCKGAELKEHHPSRQVRRAAERKGEPIYTHKTIDIGPATRVLSTEGNIKQNGLGKALHICRGHFAHYTAEKPLFGKYVGTVYKPMHLRGKADNGVVDKDYRVLTEAQ